MSATTEVLEQAEALVEEFCQELHRLLQQSREQQQKLESQARQLHRALDEINLRLQMARDGTTPMAVDMASLQAAQEEASRQEQDLLSELAQAAESSRRLELLLRQVRMSSRSLRSEEHLQPYDPWELALRSQVLYGREQERNSLAREVHDGPAQVLSNLALGLGRIRQAGSAEEMRALAESVLRDARLGLQEVRRFIYDLRPSPLAEEPLGQQIERYIRDLETAYQIDIDFQWGTPPRQFTDEEKIAVYRIVQEALQNAHRHARSERIAVEAYTEPAAWTVRVSDNGVGFDPLAAWQQPDHWGIRGMHERARLIGAELRIESRPGAGTTVTLRLPLSGPGSSTGEARDGKSDRDPDHLDRG